MTEIFLNISVFSNIVLRIGGGEKMRILLILALLFGFAFAAPEIGDPAPDWTLPNLDNNQNYHLYDYMGKVVWLNWFWTG